MKKKDKKIKIIHIVDSLETGGMENGVVNLCNNIDLAIFEPCICCLRSSGCLAKRLRDEVKLINMNTPDINVLTRLNKLAAFLKNENPDIIHTHGWGGSSFEGIIAAKIARVPVIINGEHGKLFMKTYQIRIQRLLARLCNSRLSVSGSLKNVIEEQLGILGKSITVIPNGVDTKLFNGNHDTTLLQNEISAHTGIEFRREDLIIGCIGSLKPAKNQILLLKALQKIFIDSYYTKIKILFVGDGQDRSYLEDYVLEHNLKRNVIFMGLRDDIPQLLSLMDILVSASIAGHEGMSNVILEAMSSDLPVIATNSVGTSELVQNNDNGYLIESGDVAGLANRISLLLKNRAALDKMGTNARQFVCENYSLEKMVAAYQELYTNLYTDN